LTRSLALSF